MEQSRLMGPGYFYEIVDENIPRPFCRLFALKKEV